MLIIDRISEDIAVIEDSESRFEVPRKMLGSDVSEGDAVELIDGIYVKNKNETDRRKNEILKLQNELWE